MSLQEKRTVRRVTEFSLVGAGVAAFSFVQLWLYIDVLGISAGIAYVIQTIVSVELNFFGNYFMAWGDRRHQEPFMKMHTLFWVTRGVLIFVNPFVFAGLSAVGVNYFVAQFIVLAMNTIINWFAGEKLVFKKKEA